MEFAPSHLSPTLGLVVRDTGMVASGDREGARKCGDEIVRLMPEATVTALSRQLPYAKPEDQAQLLEGLRAAGLPESWCVQVLTLRR